MSELKRATEIDFQQGLWISDRASACKCSSMNQKSFVRATKKALSPKSQTQSPLDSRPFPRSIAIDDSKASLIQGIRRDKRLVAPEKVGQCSLLSVVVGLLVGRFAFWGLAQNKWGAWKRNQLLHAMGTLWFSVSASLQREMRIDGND